MDHFVPRKIKFKAWNSEAKLLTRLDRIDCNKGELFSKGHVLLQFTGLLDKGEEEVYEMDVLLVYSEKYLVYWNPEKNGWYYSGLDNALGPAPFLTENAKTMKRLGNYFELQDQGTS
ncbi:MAG TPA: YopX family protein [Cyclobacteriaceae bacterium]|nr:YopX family protein [Cyclobacteriaceae bacterium]